MTKIVVTGGAGFIGGNLVRQLLTDEHWDEIAAIDDLSTGRFDNLVADAGNGDTTAASTELPDRVTFHHGSILDVATLNDVMQDAETVVHLAARPSVPRSIADPVACHDVNATGTLQVLEAARTNDAHVIVASSSSVYGANPTLPKSEELRTQPLSPYAASKLAAESYALAYQVCYGLPVLAFRLFNVFGPLQSARHAYAAVVPIFVEAALTSQPLLVDGDGEQTRDFTFVGSVTQVLADAARRRVCHAEPVNLAFGGQRSVNAFIDELARQLDTPLDVQNRPARVGDVRHSTADASRLRELFPAVTPVPFETGLARTIAWFRDHTG